MLSRTFDPDQFAAIYEREVGRCTATLVRVLGDVDMAEEAVAEAFTIAAQRWKSDGFPANPGGWITTTARNKAIDVFRRDTARRAKHHAAIYLENGETTMPPTLGNLDVVEDDQLRLIFLCCHPALGVDAQVALTLRLLGGLQTAEIARVFFIPDATLAQRLVRAKRKIRDTHMSYGFPSTADLPRRLPSVLGAVYLIFNEGHTATEGPEPVRPKLVAQAVRLGRLLHEYFPAVPEVTGLLALMLLTEARRGARVDGSGNLIPLDAQDRNLWDHSLIAEGHRLVRECLAINEPGRYQLQAAIAAVHADAATSVDTDWAQIVALYERLLVVQPNDVVRLNRAVAVAVAQLNGAAAGLAALKGLDLEKYHLFHAVKAEFLCETGAVTSALASLERAKALTTNQSEQRFLASRVTEVRQKLK